MLVVCTGPGAFIYLVLATKILSPMVNSEVKMNYCIYRGKLLLVAKLLIYTFTFYK